jgi:hypothetical protein
MAATYHALPQEMADADSSTPLLPDHSKARVVSWWHTALMWLKRNAFFVTIIAVLAVVFGSLQYRSAVREQAYISQAKVLANSLSDGYLNHMEEFVSEEFDLAANSSFDLFQRSNFLNFTLITESGPEESFQPHKGLDIWDSWIGSHSLDKEWIKILDTIVSLGIYLGHVSEYKALRALARFCSFVSALGL